MTSLSISNIKAITKKKDTARRSPSASEIARNVRNFEIWSTHQGCEQVSYSDLPADIKADVTKVFDVTGRLPLSWIDQASEEFRSLSLFATPEILRFIQDAHMSSPHLFSDELSSTNIAELYTEIAIVFTAWRGLQQMRKSKEKWSEADFTANVYNVFRSPALHKSTHRVHCTISLPQPMQRSGLGTQAIRILNTKTAVPDCAVLIPAANIRALSHSAKSPFKTLSRHPAIAKRGSASLGSSFRYQSTPCAQLPDTPGFEFVSSVWEDKKPVHQLLEDAYRQNRLATASAIRHLHFLGIKAPVFGLVWSNASVRAHVDWAKNEKGAYPTILSAPYSGDEEAHGDDLFHEWTLDQPGDILQVYFLIRNIDCWTTGRFCERVTKGIEDLVEAVVDKKHKYEPWKRVGDLVPSRRENIYVSITTESSPSPSKARPKQRTR
jgi:solute carrier family 25 carnitine/acylcarnitine transporter 20/29